LYIGIAGTYEIIAFASSAIVYFNLRNQVVEPFRIEGNSLVADAAAGAKRAGLSASANLMGGGEPPPLSLSSPTSGRSGPEYEQS
jgi:hypothetical protein